MPGKMYLAEKERQPYQEPTEEPSGGRIWAAEVRQEEGQWLTSKANLRRPHAKKRSKRDIRKCANTWENEAPSNCSGGRGGWWDLSWTCHVPPWAEKPKKVDAKYFKDSTQKPKNPKVDSLGMIEAAGEGRKTRTLRCHASLKTLNSANHCRRIKCRRPHGRRLRPPMRPVNQRMG